MYKIPLGLLKDIIVVLDKMEWYLNMEIGSVKVDLLKKIKKINKILKYLVNEDNEQGTD
jgi:hypothetical protein